MEEDDSCSVFLCCPMFVRYPMRAFAVHLHCLFDNDHIKLRNVTALAVKVSYLI